ncbi:MAG: M20/M25/M40 family metallo-hydrolase, partial [Pseudomonadales bacterium]
MSSNLLPRSGNAIWYSLAAFAVMLILGVQSLQPPPALSADAPAGVFSGERAGVTLRYLLGDETPHPVGSAANRQVRDRLIELLEGLGLDPEIQRTVGCNQKWPVCANVENVFAEIPGKTEDTLVLMAHYDSVPHAPGAADDGSGVATLLEAARVLLREPIRRNRILLLFTDAEEMGLLGAEGFFADHPRVADVKAVINLEGAGSGGPSLLLRSSKTAGHLLNAVRQTASFPIAISYAQEVFARMPNDTDFTVADRAGIASIDFSFAFEFNHYHTPLDTVDNLDKRSLQHHGSYVLPLARRLADSDLNARAPNFSYLTIQQLFWITWPIGWTAALAAVGLSGLLLATVRIRKIVSIGSTLAATGLTMIAIPAGILTCFAALWFADQLIGTTVNFPANPWPWRLLMGAGALLPVVLCSWWLQDRLDFWARYLGVWWLLGFLALALALYAPLAANLLIVPLLAATLLILLAVFVLDLKNDAVRTSIGIAVAAILALPLLPISYASEQTQGLLRAPAIYAVLVLLAASILPFKADAKTVGIIAVTLLLGWIWVPFATLYSEWQPQHVSLYYVLDEDEGKAQWTAISSNPIPDRLLDAFGTAPQRRAIAPWSTQQFPTFPAPVVPIPEPDVQVRRLGADVRVTYRSRTGGDYVQLLIPEAAGVSDLTVAGHAVESVARNGLVGLRLFATGRDKVEFHFRLAETDP